MSKKLLNQFVLMSVTAGGRYDMTEDNSGKVLGIAEDGYFASTAWRDSDEAYNNISGTSFGITTGDDNIMYKEDKYKMSRPSLEQVRYMLHKCDENFQKRANKILIDIVVNEFVA